MWVQDGCKVYMDSYEWIMFYGHLDYSQKPPLGGRHNHWETMALRTLTTVGLICCYRVWGPAWIEIRWNSTWLRAWSHTTSRCILGFVTTTWFLELFWDGLWTFSFGLSQFLGRGSWRVCEVVLRVGLPMDHEVGPWKMAFFQWSSFMVRLPWFGFFKTNCRSLWTPH